MPTPLWFAEGHLVWYVTSLQRLERYDLRSGERLVLSDDVDHLTVSRSRDAVAWAPMVSVQDTHTTMVHHVATGDMLEIPGYLVGLWPGVAITSPSGDLMVVDLETRGIDIVPRAVGVRVLRADRGARSLVVATDSGVLPHGKAIGRLDLDTGTFHPFADVHSGFQVATDPHGDGVIVTDVIEDADSDDALSVGRARILRISHSGATTLVDDAAGDWNTWALASDGRLLYRPLADDGTASPDLHIRNPDGSGRVFARDAGLVAPQPGSLPYFRPEELPDLEGDVLVNIRSGSSTSLWRMPFDTPP